MSTVYGLVNNTDKYILEDDGYDEFVTNGRDYSQRTIKRSRYDPSYWSSFGLHQYSAVTKLELGGHTMTS